MTLVGTLPRLACWRSSQNRLNECAKRFPDSEIRIHVQTHSRRALHLGQATLLIRDGGALRLGSMRKSTIRDDNGGRSLNSNSRIVASRKQSDSSRPTLYISGMDSREVFASTCPSSSDRICGPPEIEMPRDAQPESPSVFACEFRDSCPQW